jgi:hypothetical protein
MHGIVRAFLPSLTMLRDNGKHKKGAGKPLLFLDDKDSVNLAADDTTKRRTAEGRASIATDHVASRAADNGANSSITLRRSQAVASGEGCQECKGKHAFV